MIGDNIKKYRKQAGLTQKQLSEKLSCAEITIRQYESNKREPRSGMLEDIAHSLGVSAASLISSNDEERNQEIQNESKETQAFKKYLESLGYNLIDYTEFYGEDYEKELALCSPGTDIEIPLSDLDFQDLMDFTQAQIDLELSRIKKRNGNG